MYRHWPIYKYLHNPQTILINTVDFSAATTTSSCGKKTLKKVSFQTAFIYNNFMSYPKTFYSGLLPKNSSLDYNPVLVHRKKIWYYQWVIISTLIFQFLLLHVTGKIKAWKRKVKLKCILHQAIIKHRGLNLFKISTLKWFIKTIH